MNAIVPKRGLKVTQAKDIKKDRLKLKADAVVVGSGAGGGIMAYELAKAGKKVIVLEAGPYIPSEQFTEMLAVSMGTLYADKGGQSNTSGDTAILQGVCVGGSTVVNAALCFRTPDYYLRLWAKEFGLTNLSSETLRPYFEKVEKNLSIHQVTEGETSLGAMRLAEGCKKIGVPAEASHRNVRDCALTGYCLEGCASDRKQSMLVTYLPWAVALGATIYADTRVTKVLEKGGRATGVVAEVVDPATGKKKADVQVDAPLVVLAAGAVQTPIILFQSGLANSSGQVGKNFACHPTLSLSGYFPEEVSDFYGAFHTMHVDKHILPEDGGYLLLNAVQKPLEASFEVEPGTGKPYMRYMKECNHIIRLIALIHDRNHGEVTWENGIKSIKYDMHPEDWPAMQAAMKLTAKVLFAAGAAKVYLPASNKVEITDPSQIDTVIDGLKNEPARYRYTSYHPQGTCRMGADPKNSVVGPFGETHDVKGLYVADASILPTSIGYNPSETVYGLASYIADHIVKKSRG